MFKHERTESMITRNRLGLFLTVTLLLSSSLMMACKKDSPPAPAPAPGGASRYKLALIAKSSTNPVFLAAREGAEAAARDLSAKHGIAVEVAWLTPPQEDGQVQAQRIAQAVNEGANAIILSCSDAGKVTGAINDAVARGVEVMTFDSDAPQSKRFAFYGVDDIKLGERIMAELAPLIGDKGKVAILAGNQNAPNLRKRVEGIKQEAAKHPQIQIVDTFFHNETPQDAAAEVLRVHNAYPEITGWAMVGGWPLFTKTLLTDLDPKTSKRTVKIVAVDALPAQLPYVDKGLSPVLLAQPIYNWGKVSVETVIDKLHFKKQVPAYVPMEVERVTKENLTAWAKQLREWKFTDVPF
jgi:ribose transport system substrate-binding protein